MSAEERVIDYTDVLSASIKGNKIKVAVGRYTYLTNEEVIVGYKEFLLPLEHYTQLVHQGCVGEFGS